MILPESIICRAIWLARKRCGARRSLCFEKLGIFRAVAAATNNLGGVFLLRGDLDQARQYFQRAIPDYQAIGDKDGVALILNDLGDLLRRKGELQAAMTSYRQAKATSEEIDDSTAIAYVLTGMGDVFSDQGDFAGARKSYEESLTLRTKTGEKQAAAETQTALAQLSVEEGRAGEAEGAVRTCLQQFRQEQQTDDELAAGTVLISALTAQGKNADAQKEADVAGSLAEKSQNLIWPVCNSRLLWPGSGWHQETSNHPENCYSKFRKVPANEGFWGSSSRPCSDSQNSPGKPDPLPRRSNNWLPSKGPRTPRDSAESPPRRVTRGKISSSRPFRRGSPLLADDFPLRDT